MLDIVGLSAAVSTKLTVTQSQFVQSNFLVIGCLFFFSFFFLFHSLSEAPKNPPFQIWYIAGRLSPGLSYETQHSRCKSGTQTPHGVKHGDGNIRPTIKKRNCRKSGPG